MKNYHKWTNAEELALLNAVRTMGKTSGIKMISDALNVSPSACQKKFTRIIDGLNWEYVGELPPALVPADKKENIFKRFWSWLKKIFNKIFK